MLPGFIRKLPNQYILLVLLICVTYKISIIVVLLNYEYIINIDLHFSVQQRDQLQSTLEILQPAASWGSTAYNTFFNVTGAVASMMYTSQEKPKKQLPSHDSSDGFEMIDKNEL